MTGGPGIPVNPPVKPPNPPTEKIIKGFRFPLYRMPVLIKINRNNDGRDIVNGPIDEWKERKNIIYADYSTLDNLV